MSCWRRRLSRPGGAGYQIRWDTSVATHAYQEVEVEMGEMKPVPVWKKPKQFERPPEGRGRIPERTGRRKTRRRGKKAITCGRRESGGERFVRMQAKTLDAYYAALDGMACDYHRVRSGLDMDEPTAAWQSRAGATVPGHGPGDWRCGHLLARGQGASG